MRRKQAAREAGSSADASDEEFARLTTVEEGRGEQNMSTGECAPSVPLADRSLGVRMYVFNSSGVRKSTRKLGGLSLCTDRCGCHPEATGGDDRNSSDDGKSFEVNEEIEQKCV